MNIEIDVKEAKLKNLNVRSEGNQKEPILAMDADFEMVCPSDVAKSLLGGDSLPPFWDTKTGETLYHGIDEIGSWAEMTEAKVTFDGIEVPVAKVKKFKLKPTPGNTMKLSLQVQFRPTDDQLVAFSHRQLKFGALSIGSDQQELFK